MTATTAHVPAKTHLQTLRVSHDFYLRAFAGPQSTAQLTFHFAPSRTHILWSLGHLAWTYDVIYGLALGVTPQLPARHGELFAFATKPTDSVADYPSLDEVKAAAEASFDRIAAAVAALTEEQLAAPVPPSHPLAKFFPNLDVFLSMGSFHTGYHVGQIGLLRAAQGLSSLLGG